MRDGLAWEEDRRALVVVGLPTLRSLRRGEWGVRPDLGQEGRGMEAR